MAHNIQPAATAAPTTSFESVDEAPHGSAVSAGIAVPGPPVGEMEAHTGAQNALDPYVYKQDVYCATVPWSTNDQPGKLLHVMEVTPMLHQILAVYAIMYNCWAGGLTFVFKFCGTAFHAGMAVFVRVPPNENPADWSAGKKFTGFEYVAIDPKMQEIGTLTIRDQRQIEYHYTVPEVGTPESWGRAGWLALYVMDQLATSSTGVNQIQIEIFVKAAPDFRFSQMMLPRPNKADLIFQFPKRLLDAMSFSTFSFTNAMIACAPIACDTIEVQPQELKSLNMYRYNCFTFKGKPSSYYQYDKVFQNLGTEYRAEIAFPSVGGATLLFKYGFFDEWKVDSRVVFQDSKKAAFIGQVSQATADPWSFVLKDLKKIYPDTEASAPAVGPATFAYVEEGDSENYMLEKDVISAYTGKESILLFRASYSSKLKCMQTADIAARLSTGEFGGVLGMGMCALFQLVKTSDQLPLAYVKFYDSGLLTTNMTETALEYKLSEVSLDFVSYLPRTDPPPSNAEMAQARMLYSIVNSSKFLHPRKSTKKR